MGERRPKTDAKGGNTMIRKFVVSLVGVTAVASMFVVNALAVTTPAIPVSAYGSSLLDGLVSALTSILPYAAAITAFAIGVGMIKRWLGHRKATKV
jgi:hypothetical protein